MRAHIYNKPHSYLSIFLSFFLSSFHPVFSHCQARERKENANRDSSIEVDGIILCGGAGNGSGGAAERPIVQRGLIRILRLPTLDIEGGEREAHSILGIRGEARIQRGEEGVKLFELGEAAVRGRRGMLVLVVGAVTAVSTVMGHCWGSYWQGKIRRRRRRRGGGGRCGKSISRILLYGFVWRFRV